MKILISIIINAAILYAITYLLWPNADKWIQAWIILGCDCSYTSLEAMKTYIIGWIILGIINTTLRPILKILSLPLFFSLYLPLSVSLGLSPTLSSTYIQSFPPYLLYLRKLSLHVSFTHWDMFKMLLL